MLAALLVACDPILLDSSCRVMTETLATFLAAAGLLALSRLSLRESSATFAERKATIAALAGIVLALASLCRPAFLLWTLAAWAVLWWQAFRKSPHANANSRGPTARGRIAKNLRSPAAFALAR